VKVSAKTEYACIAMLELAGNFGSSEPVRIRTIAEEHDIPPRFLVQILLQLKGAGLVTSTRGAAGGYHLVKSPAELTLGEVMGVIEGPNEAALTSSAATHSIAAKTLMNVWNDIAAVEREMLQKITFSELLDRCKREEGMYYI
jgi:Rrf2 family protein